MLNDRGLDGAIKYLGKLGVGGYPGKVICDAEDFLKNFYHSFCQRVNSTKYK